MTTMNSDAPKSSLDRAQPAGQLEPCAEPLSKDRFSRAELSDPLLDCILQAALCAPPELERISLAAAEARVRHLRSYVPELRYYSDVGVLRLEAEAWNAYRGCLRSRLPNVGKT